MTSPEVMNENALVDEVCDTDEVHEHASVDEMCEDEACDTDEVYEEVMEEEVATDVVDTAELSDEELRNMIARHNLDEGPFTIAKCRALINSALDQTGDDDTVLVAFSFNLLGQSSLSSLHHAPQLADKLLLVGLMEKSKNSIVTTME
jgi:hypothetical protein